MGSPYECGPISTIPEFIRVWRRSESVRFIQCARRPRSFSIILGRSVETGGRCTLPGSGMFEVFVGKGLRTARATIQGGHSHVVLRCHQPNNLGESFLIFKS